MITPYSPANGAEGDVFMESWCGRCAMDAASNGSKPLHECGEGDLCAIILASVVFNPGEAGFPSEWIIDNGVPRCTAFREAEHVTIL